MRDLGLVQRGACILAEQSGVFDLPAERDEAERIVDELFATVERISQVHPFARGVGIAAPADRDLPRAAAVVLPPDNASAVVLLSPASPADPRRRTSGTRDASASSPSAAPCPARRRSRWGTPLTGESTSTVYERGLVRPVRPEIAHLDGLLCTARMRTGVDHVTVEEYRQTGRAWACE
jgi:peptide deformylase